MQIHAPSALPAFQPPNPVQHAIQAVLLIGPGHPHANANAEMIRLVAHLRAAGLAQLVLPCFATHSHPTFAHALTQCAANGATEILVVPYAITPNHFVLVELPALLCAAAHINPALRLRLAPPLGDHPSLARLIVQRALEADYSAAHPYIFGGTTRYYDDHQVVWQPLYTTRRAGLLLLTDDVTPPARRIYHALANRIRVQRQYHLVAVCSWTPYCAKGAAVLARFATHGIHCAVAVPAVLHMEADERAQLAATLAAAHAQHPSLNLLLAEPLGFDRQLITALADRISEAIAAETPLESVMS